MSLAYQCAMPSEGDAKIVMEWRNDPETLANSFHTQPKKWETFRNEYMEEYFAFPVLPPLFVVKEGRRVGFIRFRPIISPTGDFSSKWIDISIQIAPAERQRGLGGDALKEIQPWLARRGFDKVLAEIKKGNTSSQKIFEKAGFIYLDEIGKTVDEANTFTLRYVLNLTQKIHTPVFIIAEVGSNWCAGTPEKDLAQALALIDAAVDAGADAVKFQTFTAEGTYVPNAGVSDYLSQAGIRQEITEIFKEMTLPHAMLPVLAMHCKSKGIEFMSSYFSPEDFKAVDPFVKRHKMGSYEIGHLRLLELAGRSGKPLILSTGGATEEEIAWASDIFRQNGGEQLILMQCTARYPAPLSALHVRAIPWLRERFHVPIGFSDHSREPLIAPLCAVAQGAVAIEKHFTLDNSLNGPDHAFAITPPELRQLVSAIRGAEKALGSYVKFVDPEEQELRDYAHRGVQATRPIQKGDVLREGDNIAILRPGQQSKGVHSKYISDIEGKKAHNPIALGQGIQKGDW